MTAFGEAIRRLREDRGWTQQQLGDLVGIGKPAVSNVERGITKKFPPPERKKYAQAFGLTLEQLDTEWRANQIQQIVGDPERRGIPVINRSPAGLVVDYEECFTDSGQGFEYLDRGRIDDEHAFAVIVVGDSMLQTFRSGDHVIFSPLNVPKPKAELNRGAVVFVRIGADGKEPGCCIARYQGNTKNGEMKFVKDNEKYGSFVVPQEHVARIAVFREHRKTWA